jgi:AraC-like DNA-binding protein
MKQIAEALGFFDQAHFSRFFKQKMNVTPAQFKKTNAL